MCLGWRATNFQAQIPRLVTHAIIGLITVAQTSYNIANKYRAL